MKNFLLTLLTVIVVFGLGVGDVEAKRLGGGSSLGMQRQITPPQAPRPAVTPAPAPQASPATAPIPPQAPQPRRSWLGPLAGLAAGVGLAALFSHFGLGGEFGSMLTIGLLVLAAVALFRLLSRRSTGAPAAGGMQYAGAAQTSVADVAPAAPAFGGGAAAPAKPAIPPDFDADAFARQAKVNFIRLQAAHDAGNLDDIREFTTPEMYAEIRLQMADRGMSAQRTDVIELNAQVLEVVEEAQRYIVSVRFTGMLREEPGAPPAPFDEIWHLTKPRSGSGGWIVAGIQQVA
ncbi:Tim44-like domain-containing protein [Azoarcus sp. DN11]|uniref:Tim44 domain-containing protein n=1 Tax=Azoarcus sp. DN11 TaxID=356837 RepID=UPI000EB1B933|nr:Tim44-like domain-containing protein [Azoarcus sp. DN11]AYH41878.1 transporter [Azoarcus sp. DN11]